MANPTANNEWVSSVPEFGGWDHKAPGSTNYSMVFSQARANRKQQKTDIWRSLGNELDLIVASLQQDNQDSVTNNAKMCVPEFGGSDEKAVGANNSSTALSRGRANSNQQKTDVSLSLGNDQDFVAASSPHQQPHRQDDEDPVMNQRWMSVPEFGGWDQQAQGSTNYSMVFSQARANRKQQKTDVWRSLGNDQDLVAASAPHPQPHRQDNNQDSVTNLSVPEFGGWDRKAPGSTDYSTVFSQARAHRKQQKNDVRHSLGNEQDFVAASLPHQQPYRQDNDDSVSKRKKILTYINCCIRP